MSERRILLFMPYGSVGGMERLALTFYNYYKSIGHQVYGLKIIKLDTDIISFGEDEIYMSTSDFSQMRIDQRLLFYFSCPSKLKNIFKKKKITHCICFGDMANTICAFTGNNHGVYKVGSIHALKSIEFTNKSWLNKLFKSGFKTYYKNLDKVVCISKAIKKDLLENLEYKFDNLEVIYNPHDISLILEKASDKLDTDQELELFKKPVILFLGRLSIQKAPWHLLNSFYLAQKEGLSAELVFIGDGDSSVIDFLEKMLEKFKIENVHFLGRKPNPYKYLKLTKVLALSSYYEGTPNVIVEAISLGVPIVSTNCTDGIVELMSSTLQSIPKEQETSKKLDSGWITPTFFKGDLEIPSLDELRVDEPTKIFAKALICAFSNDTLKMNKQRIHNELLSKFEISFVAEKYLAHR